MHRTYRFPHRLPIRFLSHFLSFSRLTHAPILPARVLAVLLASALPWSAMADGRLVPASVPTLYTQECSACHVAYPPGFLPQTSWQRMMRGLDRHYGSDASLDAASVREIERWLVQHAGTYKRVSPEPPPQDRITRSAWFERKHRKIPAATWKHPSVKSAAQCAACHIDADRGQFDEHRIRWPQSLPAHLRGRDD